MKLIIAAYCSLKLQVNLHLTQLRNHIPQSIHI